MFAGFNFRSNIFCSLLVCVSSGLYSDEITRYYRHLVYTFFDMFEPLFYEEISKYQEIIESTAHLILDFAKNGGFENASSF